MFLLDTNVISELRRPRPHGAVFAWLNQTPGSAFHISAVTIGEIQIGVEIVREQDPAKAAEIEAWLEKIAGAFNILPADAETYRRWARLLHGRQKALSEDALIAATALQHGLTVATRNTRDFAAFGVATLNPFLPGIGQEPG